jgi:hypothetical protein
LNADVFRHIGGAVIGDCGPLSLAQARDLVRFYAREALHCQAAGERALARVCAGRALGLHTAVGEADLWRRAAGWRDPDAADR